MNAPLRLPAADDGLLARALAGKLERIVDRGAAGEAETILSWLEMLHAEDRDSAVAVAARLEQLLAHVDAAGLARWILGGLRRHARDARAQRAYFRLEDPHSVEALRGEGSADDLAHALPSLGLLLAGLAGQEITVQPRRQTLLNAPPLRPVLTGRHLLLPDSYTVADGTDRYRIYRAAVAHAAAHLLFSPLHQPVASLKPMGVAVVSAVEDARAERLLLRELPGVRAWFMEFLAVDTVPGDLGFAALITRMSRALFDPCYEDNNHWVNKARELFHAAEEEHGLCDYTAFRGLASVLANDLGQMRVRFNPQEYSVPVVYRDDNSCLWDFGAPPEPQGPPQELQVRGAVFERVPREAAPASGDPPGGALEVETGRFVYPEWDHRIGLERQDWCTVIESLAGWRPDPLHSATVPPTVAHVPLARRAHLSRARRLRRQWEGDDIDLDSAIEVMVERTMRRASEARLFMRPGKEPQASHVIVLLDLSESANDRIGGTMRSVLDLEKQAALTLVNAVRQGSDRIAVHGFASETRNRVHYRRLLDVDAPLDAAGARRILSAEAGLSTRMGAALRHAARQLAPRRGERRAIILVTDGAPSDVDVFDPEYLIEDARQAVQCAARRGVDCYCVAVDAAADAYVRRIFGWRNYRVVDSAETLPAHLASLYARLAQA